MRREIKRFNEIGVEKFFETENDGVTLKSENFTLTNLSHLHASDLEMIKCAKLVMGENGDPLMADLIEESLRSDFVFEKVVKIFKCCNVRMAIVFVAIMISTNTNNNESFLMPCDRACIENLALAKRIVRGRAKCTVF